MFATAQYRELSIKMKLGSALIVLLLSLQVMTRYRMVRILELGSVAFDICNFTTVVLPIYSASSASIQSV